MSLRTEIFLKYSFDDSFKRLIQNILKPTDDLFARITDLFDDEDPRLTRESLAEIASSFDVNPNEVRYSYDAVESLISVLVNTSVEDADSLLADINELDSEIVEDQSTAKRRLAQVIEFSKRFFDDKQKDRTAHLGGVLIKHMSGVVVSKPIIAERYAFHSSDIENYNPEVSDFSTLVQIEIEFTDDNVVSFQVTEKALNYMINDLIALKKEVISTKERLSNL